jgi:Chitin synthase
MRPPIICLYPTLQVHFNAPMNPLELEIYHQIKNVIGVNPSFYEYLFTVDADTTVSPLSLNRLVSAYVSRPFPCTLPCVLNAFWISA